MSKAIECAYCGNTPREMEPQTVQSGPAKGVRISKAWVVCACGWKSPQFVTLEDAIVAWNAVMRIRNEQPRTTKRMI